MWIRQYFCSSCVSVLVAASIGYGQIQYDDGGIHTLDESIADSVFVTGSTVLNFAGNLSREGILSLLPDDAAEEIFANGLGHSAFRVDGESQVIVNDGVIDCSILDFRICESALLVDGSVADFQGGLLRGGVAVELRNNATFNISSGNIDGAAYFLGVGISAIASHVNVTGGDIYAHNSSGQAIVLDADSTLSMTAGTVRSFGWDSAESYAVLANGADVSISGGFLGTAARFQCTGIRMNGGRLTMNGGEVEVLSSGECGGEVVHALGSAEVTMTDGQITAEGVWGFLISDSASVGISGGTVTTEWRAVHGAPEFDRGVIRLTDNGHLQLSGGSIVTLGVATARSFHAEDSSSVEVVGREFNYVPNVPIADLEGTLTGIWPDGTPFELSFRREAGATVIPVLVPEPSATILAGSLLLWVFAPRRRWHRY